MKLELQDAKGSTGVFIELPLEKLKEELGLLSSSTEAEAQLKESQGKVTELESKVAELEGKKSLVDQVAGWIDTGVIAELVVSHLKAEGLPHTFEQAKAVWLDTLETLGSHLAQLKVLLAEGGGRTMDDFTQMEKANFVIGWAKELSPEKKAVFAQAVGLPIAGAKVEEVEEVAEVEENPKIIQGKTDKPGYIFYEYLNLSMRE